MAFIPFILAVAAGCLLAKSAAVSRGLRPRLCALLLELSIGAGLGAGISSCLYFVLLASGLAGRGSILAANCFLLAIAALLYWKMRPAAAAETAPPPQAKTSSLVLIFSGLALVACLLPAAIGNLQLASSNPHGLWDAWAIWNLRAKYLAGDAEAWRYALSPLLDKTHPDYPLLLSGFIAENWRFAGQFDTSVPIVTGFMFSAAVIAILASALAVQRSLGLAAAALMVMLSDQQFLTHLGGQLSDIPLGFFYLASITTVLLMENSDEPGRAAAALAGALAALAAWTKDEGIVFALIFLVCFAALEFWRGGAGRLWRNTSWALAGALPVLALVGIFKLMVAPPANPLTSQPASEAAARILTADRVWTLVKSIWVFSTDRGAGIAQPLLVLALAVAGLGFLKPLRFKKTVVFGWVVLGLLFGGYCAAILANPTLLGHEWSAPFDRMFSQLWPSFLLALFLTLRAPEEFLPAAPSPAQPERIKKKRSARRGHGPTAHPQG